MIKFLKKGFLIWIFLCLGYGFYEDGFKLGLEVVFDLFGI